LEPPGHIYCRTEATAFTIIAALQLMNRRVLLPELCPNTFDNID
jgi:hypothetical protein